MVHPRLELFAFHPSRWALVLTCILTPWVDERFVLALPVALVTRTIFFERDFSFPR